LREAHMGPEIAISLGRIRPAGIHQDSLTRRSSPMRRGSAGPNRAMRSLQ
jgi:hypothetical protein